MTVYGSVPTVKVIRDKNRRSQQGFLVLLISVALEDRKTVFCLGCKERGCKMVAVFRNQCNGPRYVCLPFLQIVLIASVSRLYQIILITF